ncbi:lipopolysaccharide biosynthesis protein [Foetidibacter luteolus]|uniref:lipopolysaccharide biosynthesis protein n=1 Tax=Foetidibacter luteolus TaxID=2608880 RepID=UPI00129A3214|nr:polysaccharide biosynthesis C-terminal domain-containing protein [Foetidibacter luteolus]
MGIIRKQSIYSSIFTYLGFAIGGLNFFILFPHFLTNEQIGLSRLLLDFGMLFAAVCTFGSMPIIYKFYPFYKSYLPDKKNDLPFVTILLTLVGTVIFLWATIYFKDFILRKFGARSPLFLPYYDLIYPITISLAILNLAEAYAWSLRRTVISNFLKEVGFRLITSLLLAFLIFKWINIHEFFIGYSFIYFPAGFILITVFRKAGQLPLNFSFSNLTKRIYKKIFAFSMFIYAGQLLNVVSRTIDGIIISSQSLKGLVDVAVFTYATYFISIMEVPQRSMTSIATPIIAEAWKNKDLGKIKELYQKTSLNLLIAGLGIWGLCMVNMNSAIAYLGPEYSPMKTIVLIMGIAKLVDLGTGMNSQILILSKYWKLDFASNTLFVLFAIPLNYFLIRRFGVIGSAWANFIGFLALNVARYLFIMKAYRLQPFTAKTATVILIAGIVTLLCYLLPFMGNIYLDVAVRSTLFAAIFIPLILRFNVSEDFSALFAGIMQKIRTGR